MKRTLSKDHYVRLLSGYKRWLKKNPDFHRGKNSNFWKGGKRITTQGYVLIYAPNHPEAGMDWAVPEHRLVAEYALGRPLKKGEIVHHINGNKMDNRNCNLLICSTSYHKYLENKMAQLYKEEHFAHIN